MSAKSKPSLEQDSSGGTRDLENENEDILARLELLVVALEKKVFWLRFNTKELELAQKLTQAKIKSDLHVIRTDYKATAENMRERIFDLEQELRRDSKTDSLPWDIQSMCYAHQRELKSEVKTSVDKTEKYLLDRIRQVERRAENRITYARTNAVIVSCAIMLSFLAALKILGVI